MVAEPNLQTSFADDKLILISYFPYMVTLLRHHWKCHNSRLHKIDQKWQERQSCVRFSCRTLKLLLITPNENITSIYLNYKWLVTIPKFKFRVSYLMPLVCYLEVGKTVMVVADTIFWQEGMESSPCLYSLWGLDNLQITSQWLHFWRQLKTKLLQVWMSRRMRIGLTRMWWKKGDSHLLLQIPLLLIYWNTWSNYCS